MEFSKKTIFHYKSKEHIHWLIKNLRNYPLSEDMYYVYLGDDLIIYDTNPRVLVNMLIFNIIERYNVDKAIRKEFIFTGTYNKGMPVKYMNKLVKALRKYPIKDEHIFLPYLLSEIKEQFYLLAIIVNGVVSLDHSMYDYLIAYRNSPKLRAILDNPVIDYSMTSKEINTKCNEIADIFEKDIELQPLSDFYKSGVKINRTQAQSLFCYGFIPNPVSAHLKYMFKPIVGGFLNGFMTKYDQYAVDLMGVIALHKGKAEVKEPGLVNKRLNTMLTQVRLNKADTRETLHDCKTERLFHIKIQDEKDLEFFRYKYFVPVTKGKINTNNPGWDYIDIDRKDLIGKVLAIRSFMLCDGEDVICETCFGYNYKFLQDNDIHKNTLASYVTTFVSNILQKIISVKHHLSANYKEVRITYKGIDYLLEDFYEKYDYITNIYYDVIFLNSKKYKVDFIHHEKDKQKSTFGDLYIDGEPLIINTAFERIDPDYDVYKMLMPNNTVMTSVKDMFDAISTHDKRDYVTGKKPFDDDKLKGKTVPAQLWMIYEFLKDKLEMPHFIYYETLVYAFARDSANVRERVTKDTELVKFSNVSDIIVNPSKNPSLSTGLVHGYIKDACMQLDPGDKPSEFDILYYLVKERDNRSANIYEEFNAVLDGLDDNIENNEGDDCDDL